MKLSRLFLLPVVFIICALVFLNFSYFNRRHLKFKASIGEEGGYTPLIVKPGDDANTTLTYCWRVFSYIPIEVDEEEKIEAKIILKPDERFPNTEFGTVVVELNGFDIATLEVKNLYSEVETSFDPNILKDGENLLVVKGITFEGALYFSVEVYVVPKE